MGVGAIGAVGAVSYNPYIYNTRQVNSSSLNKIKAIPDDATQGGVDASGLVKDNKPQENINPLAKGQTSNFADVLMSQLSMSANKQAELIGTNTQFQLPE